MKNITKANIITISFIIFIVIIGVFTIKAYSNSDSKTFIIKNNSTRDYKYEHYCDSIYINNPNYYLDVLVETDKFQNYIDNHGEWWTN